jgi:hypothetical protein
MIINDNEFLHFRQMGVKCVAAYLHGEENMKAWSQGLWPDEPYIPQCVNDCPGEYNYHRSAILWTYYAMVERRELGLAPAINRGAEGNLYDHQNRIHLRPDR